MALEFNRFTKIATVPLADGDTITVQSIYDQFRDFEDEPQNLDLKTTITAGGKDDLGGGQFTVITVTLLDGWRVAFESAGGPAFEIKRVTEGNLVALDEAGLPQFPIAPNPFVNVVIAQATTGAILGAVSADEVWDYSGPFAENGMGDFIKRQVLTIAKFFQIVK
jgi:hypothetical protein